MNRCNIGQRTVFDAGSNKKFYITRIAENSCCHIVLSTCLLIKLKTSPVEIRLNLTEAEIRKANLSTSILSIKGILLKSSIPTLEKLGAF